MQVPGFGRTVESKTEPSNTESAIVVEDDRAIDDFEFAFTSVESNPGVLTGASADEIFSNGRILPVYPVFNQDLLSGVCETSGDEELVEGMDRLELFLKKRDTRSGSASSSSTISLEEADNQKDLPSSEAAYCIWTPRSAPQSPNRWQKSSSTGSLEPEFRRFRLRDLIIGRSPSDGKEKLLLFPDAEKEINFGFRPNPSHKVAPVTGKKGNNGKGKGKEGAVKELDVATAHRIYYGKRSTGARQSFLPYRKDLLTGFFAPRNYPFA